MADQLMTDKEGKMSGAYLTEDERKKVEFEEACRILEINGNEDITRIKRQYRRLMGRFHPDAAGSDHPEHLKQAQLINGAYDFLKHTDMETVRANRSRRQTAGGYRTSKDRSANGTRKAEHAWHGCINEGAFCERPVYQYYHLDDEDIKGMHYQAASGKYMWQPENEEFVLFIMSIHHAVKELLENAESHVEDLRLDHPVIQERRFEVQAYLFHALTQQFVNPLQVMTGLSKPVRYDKEGRSVWHFRAWLGTKNRDQVFQRIADLQPGDLLYPKSFKGSKILVRDQEGQVLGHLSFEEDWVYLCVIPLLKRKLAQVRMTAAEVEIRQGSRPYAVKADVDFYLRAEKNAADYQASGDLNLKIADLLLKYELYLKQHR